MALVRKKGLLVHKYFYIGTVGTVVATALVAMLPATSAAAASVHVLTRGKAGGPAVAPGAVLKASLARGSSVVFKNNLGTLTCTRSTFTAKVISNPAKPGTARESITAQTFSSCRISIPGVPGVTIKTVRVGNLPYAAAVSDSRGFPVKISGHSRTKPLLMTVTAKFGTSTITCSVKAASISGAASNKGNVIAFVTHRFTKAAGGSFCPTSGTFSVKYGPVTDSSVRGNPAVFVN
jgi:hypothetical protein